MTNADHIWDLVEGKTAALAAMSDRIWEKPQLNYAETEAAAEHAAILEAEGFAVTAGVAEIPTAMTGEFGAGGSVIAILGEYDALPGLSQEAGVAEHRPIVEGGNGHGCGHNVLGAGSLLAAIAIKDWLKVTGLPGRVRYYGCPAEEGGSAKGFMVRAGFFDDVDVALCWHPAAMCAVNPPFSLACQEILFTFHGRASHAASAPELGRSALDAVELMNVGVNYMREHMSSTARVHYALIDAGGQAPNVVQARAVVRYLVRAPELDEMHALVARVRRVADGAAMMTETRVESRIVSGDANLLGNAALEAAMQAELERLGPPAFDDADRAFAEEIRATLSQEEIRAAFRRFGMAPLMDMPLCDRIVPLGQGQGEGIGSTDVGTVSWVVPTVQIRSATYAIGTPGHSWQLVAQGKSGIAHKGMEQAAKAMAAMMRRLMTDPILVAAAKRDFAAARAGRPFVNPIPDETMPELPKAQAAA
ncbi:MAG TPA: amidohydrolase [Acidisoma sp.]|jgi:aminobenzoyl-glutamate utilization protein B|nr:amidohydrolase [Acidisoma sp.]